MLDVAARELAALAERLANEVLADRRKIEDLSMRSAANRAALAELSSGRCGAGRGGCHFYFNGCLEHTSNQICREGVSVHYIVDTHQNDIRSAEPLAQLNSQKLCNGKQVPSRL